MHDTLISKDIIEAAKKQGNVKGITVEVGDLGHLPAEELQETLSRMAPGWHVTIVRKKAKAKCICGYEGEPKILEHTHGHSVYFCPNCKRVPEIIEGKDIVLKEVEVE
ncbi:hydrogenase maturation nickel metallochaperone HypA [Candidatus Woesearchaeota archaeon]|jgi:Zn finger protein HypA/HybF involved in hydrogenase expression|nr:hydrogenase maturation nickel metallochaperone HypA [Candidatus Woesearchaeota archaeon]